MLTITLTYRQFSPLNSKTCTVYRPHLHAMHWEESYNFFATIKPYIRVNSEFLTQLLLSGAFVVKDDLKSTIFQFPPICCHVSEQRHKKTTLLCSTRASEVTTIWHYTNVYIIIIIIIITERTVLWLIHKKHWYMNNINQLPFKPRL